MKALPLETTVLMITTTGIGYLMLTAGLQKRALERRQRRRTCAGCGKHLPGRSICSCSS